MKISFSSLAEQDINFILQNFPIDAPPKKSVSTRKAIVRKLAYSIYRPLHAIHWQIPTDIEINYANKCGSSLPIPDDKLHVVQSQYGHYIFYQFISHTLRVIRVIDGRKPHMVLCESLLKAGTFAEYHPCIPEPKLDFCDE